jgi:hypothetical protein
VVEQVRAAIGKATGRQMPEQWNPETTDRGWHWLRRATISNGAYRSATGLGPAGVSRGSMRWVRLFIHFHQRPEPFCAI